MKFIVEDKQIEIQVEEYNKQIKEEIPCGNEIDKNTLIWEIMIKGNQCRKWRKVTQPTNLSEHKNARIKVIEEVKEENTCEQTYLNKLENLILVDCEATWEMPCMFGIEKMQVF